MKKMTKNKAYKTNEAWVMVGVIVITLLLLLAYIIKVNRIDEKENLSKTERIVNKVQQLKDVKNTVKKAIN